MFSIRGTLFAIFVSHFAVITYGNSFQNNFHIYRDSKSLQMMIDEINQLKSAVERLRMSQLHNLPMNCAEATALNKRSGLYDIKPNPKSNETFTVECDADTEGGNWTVIQRRQDGSVDFYRNWNEYKEGFGDLQGEFFIGLNKLYELTNIAGNQELLIIMEKNDSTTAYAKYDSFAIGGEMENYILRTIGNYSGTAGDSLRYHVGCLFTTKDRDNDSGTTNCAHKYSGAWWYRVCHHSNLNGVYGDNTHGKGVNWLTFSGYESSLKTVKMMIRRRISH